MKVVVQLHDKSGYVNYSCCLTKPPPHFFYIRLYYKAGAEDLHRPPPEITLADRLLPFASTSESLRILQFPCHRYFLFLSQQMSTISFYSHTD